MGPQSYSNYDHVRKCRYINSHRDIFPQKLRNLDPEVTKSLPWYKASSSLMEWLGPPYMLDLGFIKNWPTLASFSFIFVFSNTL